MALGNLVEIVRNGVSADEVHLIPVIEKELLHYDVLAAMEKLGLLEQLVFHGGTCLRLCYGAQRRSEDLDFAYHGNLEDLRLEKLEQVVSESLQKKFNLHATVRPPTKTIRFTSAEVQRWWMVVDTAPERPDLPSQKLKIELISVETLTSQVCRIAKNYDYLAPSAGNTLAVCETREEILADKMIAFVNTPPTYVRKRDVWDMAFLLSQAACDREKALTILPEKRKLYGCELSEAEFCEEGQRRVYDILGSDDFEKEMKRFVPTGVYDQMFGTEMKSRFVAEEISSLYMFGFR